MSDLTGQLLGHYRLIHKIGTGGFAHVYRAEHIYLKTQVAIKVLIANLAHAEMQNFLNEAQVVARLDHPHIVRVRDFGIEAGIPYLVMDYALNGTLRQRHPEGARAALSLVVTYVGQLASALQYAHTQGMIHRDVKPDNILLGSNNKLLLSDFGAALVTRATQKLSPQNVIGTLSYMAPEQIQGNPSSASDQYALGVVVYEWLCGHCPFEGPAVTHLHLNVPPPSLRAKVPTLSYAVEQVVMRALAKQPEQRFANVQTFAIALAEAFEQASKRVPTPPLVIRGDATSRGSLTMLSARRMITPLPPPSPRPHLVAPSLPATPLPVTIAASPSFPSRPPLAHIAREPRHSRRTFIHSAMGLVAVGAVAGLALALANHQGAIASEPTRAELIYSYKGHQDEVFTAAWSPDGRYIASAGGNKAINSRRGDTKVHVWNAQTGDDVYVYLGHSYVVRKVAWSLDGTRIASASEDGTVQVWDAITGNNPLIYRGHNGAVIALAWSPDGTRIASASADKTVQIWDATSGKNLFTYIGHVTPVIALDWSPDGTRVVSAGSMNDSKMVNDVDKVVKVWDAATGAVSSTCGYSRAQAGALAWSPNGEHIAIGYYEAGDGTNLVADDSVRLWDINTPNPSQILSGTLYDQVYALDWSPRDGKYLSVGYNWGEVKVWDSIAQKQILDFRAHSQPVMGVQWSRQEQDSRKLVTCGFDHRVKIWMLS
jgi:eukaryotic-like serine/threonine-protein kinase